MKNKKLGRYTSGRNNGFIHDWMRIINTGNNIG